MDKILVDRGKCQGLGVCESLAGAYFETDDDGDLVVLETDVQPEDFDAVSEAISSCPTEALQLLRA